MKFCKIIGHRWRKYRRETSKTTFFCRECRHCHVHQLQYAGPMGDDSWRNFATLVFRWSWEQEEWVKSVDPVEEARKFVRFVAL